jgi:hypothetical protein
MIIRARAILALLITLSLVAVPVGVGASAAGVAVSNVVAASDCGAPCPMAGAADEMAGMSMSGGCHDAGGKSMPSPSACAALCNGLVLALPSHSLIVARVAGDELPSPGAQAALAGRTERPDLPPPRS